MKRVLILLFLGLMGFYSSEGIVARLDLTSHLMLSNPGYAKHIEVQFYLVTREQVAKAFMNGNLSVEQKTNKELFQKIFF